MPSSSPLHRSKLLLFFIVLLALFYFSSSSLSSSSQLALLSLDIRQQVDHILDNAVSTFIHSLQTDRSIESALNVFGIQQVQDSLACYIQQGSWSGQSFEPNTRCFSPSDTRKLLASPVLDLCSSLRTKNVLLVGPEPTFYLHSVWLNSLAGTFNVSNKCPGAEFCAFHHICVNQSVTALASNTRIKKLPSSRELITYSSSILRFSLSTTLYATSDSRDLAYTTPIVDEHTGVRVKNSYWIFRARKADILVMNRGPVPAPAWTYSFGSSSKKKSLAGNWSFVDLLYLNQSTRYLNLDPHETPSRGKTYHHRYQRAIHIINAALHSTLTVFLPGVIQTLYTIQKDAAIRIKVLVWHGSWFLNPICTNYGHPKGFAIEPQLLPLHLNGNELIGMDPWSLYYNAQGTIYMHDQLLPSLLPHFGIVYLPLSIPLAPANAADNGVRNSGKQHLGEEVRKDCIRYSFGKPEEKAIATAFLGGMVKLLEQIQ